MVQVHLGPLSSQAQRSLGSILLTAPSPGSPLGAPRHPKDLTYGESGSGPGHAARLDDLHAVIRAAPRNSQPPIVGAYTRW